MAQAARDALASERTAGPEHTREVMHVLVDALAQTTQTQAAGDRAATRSFEALHHGAVRSGANEAVLGEEPDPGMTALVQAHTVGLVETAEGARSG